MPCTLRRTQRRALTFTRSLATAVKTTLSSSLFCDKNQTCSPFGHTSRHPTIPKHDIGRPRQLRRGHIPAFKYVHFIHRLPIELLAHIFVIGSEDDALSPITVSHVCHAWREIALRTPTLWRRIQLSPRLDMWTERIYRAGACTLDIQLLPWIPTRSFFPKHQHLDMHMVQWYIHFVAPLIRRWRSLEIVFADYSPFLWNASLSAFCSRSRRIQATSLESLTLVYRANDDTKEFCLFSGFAPRLRSVTLDGIRLAWLPSLFGNLTYLDYTHHGFTSGYDAVHDVIKILDVSSRLVELKILFPRKPLPAIPTRTQAVSRRVLLPSLITLHLRVEGIDIPFELAHLMTLILTPALTHLRFVDLERRQQPFYSLKSFFYVYAIPPSLRSLTVEHGWYDPPMVTPILRSLPSLRQLVVRRSHSPDHVLNLHSRSRKGRHQMGDVSGHMHLHVHPDRRAHATRRQR
ncbi:hypothetical protein Hypma_000944 [Hypsizygus marmoreus]|uniref:F-box domain-containing protein n=1 Tax=Hypsizygus marmoreus TaxID=39966 RepID=A0A369JBH4_HYPMA|nr:hypothetical protein Hypma_000944 [Hypsizygus marmoreus]